MAEGRRAAEMVPLSKESVNAVYIHESLALIYAWCGVLDLQSDRIIGHAPASGRPELWFPQASIPAGTAAARRSALRENRRLPRAKAIASPYVERICLQSEIRHRSRFVHHDIVGYSKLLINEQSEQIQKLKEIVRGTEQFRLAEAEGKLLRLPTGDGGALVFRNSPEAPVMCALEISKALKNHPELRVRMGIHSGPVNEVTDLNEQANIAGAGINIAQRVMDCGDARAHSSLPACRGRPGAIQAVAAPFCMTSANAKSNTACAFTS